MGEVDELRAENESLRLALQEAQAQLAKFGAETKQGCWRKFDELREEQTDAIAAMFSGDFYIERDFDAVLRHRRQFGYFITANGTVLCRRRLPEIKNWNAADPWEG